MVTFYLGNNAARRGTQQSQIFRPDVLGKDGNVQSNLSALVKSNLTAGNITVDYALTQDGKTYIEIVSIDGAVLKVLEVDRTKGKHTKTINLDNQLLKNKMAVLVVKQGNSKTANPFIISQ